jgi:hypothetical protein
MARRIRDNRPEERKIMAYLELGQFTLPSTMQPLSLKNPFEGIDMSPEAVAKRQERSAALAQQAADAFRVSSESPESVFNINPTGNIHIKSAVEVNGVPVEFDVPFGDLLIEPNISTSFLIMNNNRVSMDKTYNYNINRIEDYTKLKGRIHLKSGGEEIGSVRYWVFKAAGAASSTTTPISTSFADTGVFGRVSSSEPSPVEKMRASMDYGVKKGWLPAGLEKAFSGYIAINQIAASTNQRYAETFGSTNQPYAVALSTRAGLENAMLGAPPRSTFGDDSAYTTIRTWGQRELDLYEATMPEQFKKDIDDFYNTTDAGAKVLDMVENGVPLELAQQAMTDQAQMTAQYKKEKMILYFMYWMKKQKPATMIPAVITENADKALRMTNRAVEKGSYYIVLDYLEIKPLLEKVSSSWLMSTLKRAMTKIADNEFKTFNYTMFNYLAQGGTPMNMYAKSVEYYNKQQEKKSGTFNLFDVIAPVLSMIPGPTMVFGLAISTARMYQSSQSAIRIAQNQQDAQEQVQQVVDEIEEVIPEAVAIESNNIAVQQDLEKKSKTKKALTYGSLIAAVGGALFFMLD